MLIKNTAIGSRSCNRREFWTLIELGMYLEIRIPARFVIGKTCVISSKMVIRSILFK
jgi:hypothetical protein